MGKNTSVSLGDHFESFVEQAVSSGKYASVSEVIRSALRLLETQDSKLNMLRKALEEGEQSGSTSAFDPEKHLDSLHRRLD
jgi:antitoxin ParD1/3/4